jgi:hypothetical protein
MGLRWTMGLWFVGLQLESVVLLSGCRWFRRSVMWLKKMLVLYANAGLKSDVFDIKVLHTIFSSILSSKLLSDRRF